MRAKGVEFDVTYINLQDRPDWFAEISPHGKVPVLKVGGVPLFESNAIAEFIDETVEPRLHPADPVKRARNRAWTDFVPTFASAMSSWYYATSAAEQAEGYAEAREELQTLEEAIARERGNDGPYFNGPDLSLVDASYAPFLQRLLLVEDKLKTGLLDDFPLVQAWARALMANPFVNGSVHETFNQEFAGNMHRRGTVVAQLFPKAA